MADNAVKEEKSWWDSFVEGVSELGTTYLNYDIAKTKASNSSTVDTTPVTTYPNGNDNTTLLLVGGAALILVVLLVARK